MYEDTEKFVDLDFEQRVRQRAYDLWEKDGRQGGRETDYWFEALRMELDSRERPDAEA
ncbi:MAG: DUF2934 domain-containing protein [Alphaproteobacteria bacterium]|jgi:hypothetical protein|nr:DUF2934 domain-containing protein [Alphaproteobacteria bacterium]MBU1562630.1 DUF2934 domain-containing protein [Alphaproteobacteria bacterium]MBU2303386.1 DUF2934 domain-containing protein [Alphaproteobacteria bacterium]MBU2366911.1 DUF2934 domain-containing protein [Alphaproteobacteria bacterium]